MCHNISNSTIFKLNAIGENLTQCVDFHEDVSYEMHIYLLTCYASGIYLSILSFMTVIFNGVLLFVLYKDPLNHKSRHPLTILIMGLASADFFTGIAVDPLFAYFYFEASKGKISDEKYNILLKSGTVLSGISMNVSFLVVLFLSWAQLIAIQFPHKQKQFITRARTTICVILIWIYSIFFSFLNFMGVPEEIFHKLDVYLHLSAVQIVIIVSYVFLCVAYKRHFNRLIPFLNITKAQSNSCRALEQHRRTQRQLIVVNLMLTSCLIFFVLPVTIAWYINLYWQPSSYSAYLKSSIASIIVDTTLYMKFLIDPFIYGWRLPKFRQAVVAVFQGRRRSSTSISLAMFSKTLNNVN